MSGRADKLQAGTGLVPGELSPGHWPGTFTLPDRTPRDELQPQPSAFSRPIRRAGARLLAWGGLSTWATCWLLYCAALLPLLFNLGGYPAFTYNWEEYSTKGIFDFLAAPTLAHFAPTDGLMTDSGHSPLIVLPVALAWAIGGPGVLALRLPIAFLAAGAVPLCWLFGRRIVGERAGLLAAALLALSPVFILYARTATLVGVSLVPALVTALLLWRAIERPTVPRVALLQLALLGVGWGYGPIRFLWPIAVAALAAELLLRRGLQRRFAVALLITITVLPLVLWSVARHATPTAEAAQTPLTALRGYYNGRGEQAFSGDRAGLRWDVLAPMLEKNARDSLGLLLDRETKPTLLDFWNPHGRLHEGWLVPLLALGLAWAGWRMWRDPGARLLLLMLAGFWLPLLLTSNVHVGRLIYVVPLLALLTARGAATVTGWIARLVAIWLAALRPRAPFIPLVSRAARASLVALLLFGVAWRGWQDYTMEKPLGNMVRGVAILEDHATAQRGTGRPTIVLLGLNDPQDEGNTTLTPQIPEIERLNLAAYRLRLDRAYRFVDIGTHPGSIASPDPADTRPILLYGADPVTALRLGDLCAATYFTIEELAPTLAARTATLACPVRPTVLALPR